MGYGIRDDHFDESYELIVRGRCGCGRRVVEELRVTGAAGRIGLSDLAADALRIAERACRCGLRYRDHLGVAALHHLAGGDSWVAVVVGTDDVRVHCASSHERALGLIGSHQDGLGLSELAVSRRAGTPSSVVAAWHEALLARRLGNDGAFPCGPGLWALIAEDAAAAREILGRSGGDGELVRLVELESGKDSPADWLGQERDQIGLLWAACDWDRLHEQIAAEARRCRLDGDLLGGQLRLHHQDPSLHETVECAPIIAQALRSGRVPRLQAGAVFLRLRHRLKARERALGEALETLHPRAWRIDPAGRELVLLLEGGRERRIDLVGLAELSDEQRTARLGSVD